MCQFSFRKLFVASIVVFVLIITQAGGIFADNGDIKSQEVYYKHIEVAAGDSLWAIASEYAGDSMNVNAYIKEIKAFNHMRTNVLYAGDYIIVPVYK